MKKKICIALIGALTAAAFAGCSGGGSSQSGETTAETAGSQEAGTETSEGESAQKADSGEITVYTALEDEQVSDYLAKFNETYPDITVNIVRESTGIITAKLIAEKDNPQADLVWGTAASSMMALDDMGALEPYEPEGCDRILPQFK